MKLIVKSFGSCAGLIAILAGCASNPPAQDPVTTLFEKPDIAVKQAFERKHLNGRPPKLGLALSGGGTKAAIFSHGVLHGLSEQNILDNVDVISSTSGGGYAAYWYFSKRLDVISNPQDYPGGYRAIFRDCFPAWIADGQTSANHMNILKRVQEAEGKEIEEVCPDSLHISKKPASQDPYRWQAHLLRWPDVFKPGITVPPKEVHPYWNQTVNVLASLIEGPIRLLGGSGDSYTAVSYQYGIERAWGLNPGARKPAKYSTAGESWEYNNKAEEKDPRWFREFLHVNPATMTWAKLRNAYDKDPKLPLWILNTTQGQKKDNEPKAENLFELTPFGYGSPRWGYFTGTLPPLQSIAEGVRASAAFADSQGLGDSRQMSLLRNVAKVFPAATWGVPLELPNKEKVRLSDGGGADDLALVSAVRRGLDDIIIVDTASDGRGVMDDLCWSGKLLSAEGFEMSFPALLDLKDVCATLFGGGGTQHGYNVSAWMNPVVKGTLKWPNSERTTNLWLIKAAWDEQSVRRAFETGRCGFSPGEMNCLLAIFWGNELHKEGKFMGFPQHSTAGLTLDSNATLALAYRELGRMLAQNLQIDSHGKISIRKEQQCKQRALPVRENRPEDRLSHSDSPECY